MDIFKLRDKITREDYAKFASSFISISNERIRREVDEKFASGLLWPEPLLQLNPSYASGGFVDDLVAEGKLHPECSNIFRVEKDKYPASDGLKMRLYQHQKEAIEAARSGEDYVLTTGTGSGKSLSYIIPIVNSILYKGGGRGIKAIIVYPMNAHANSQERELEKFLRSAENRFPVSFRRYTGQEGPAARKRIIENPPDILLTNYVMLEYILTRPRERPLVDAAKGLEFLVFDELHTYRGRQGADVAMLIRRLKRTLNDNFQCVGTSATLAGEGTYEEKAKIVAEIAGRLFGSEVHPRNVIMETLAPETASSDYTPDNLAAFLRSGAPLPDDYENFVANPLVIWIERAIGPRERDGRYERGEPRPLGGANGLAAILAKETGTSEEDALKILRDALLKGSAIKKSDGKPAFAFKLHQFVSRGDTVYATLESDESRYITLFGQKLAPGRDDNTLLYPLRFCRECGKEYYPVKIAKEDGETRFLPLAGDDLGDEDLESSFLFIDDKNFSWPEETVAQLERLPDDWIEEKNGDIGVAKNKRNYLPEKWHVEADGLGCQTPTPDAVDAWLIPARFRFCPACGVSYEAKGEEFARLGTLGAEGRSAAITILSMSAINRLKETDLAEEARKFLCFSDNRQDASLQAGHFNDFIERGLIRSALFNALLAAGDRGLSHAELPPKILEALGLGYDNGKFPKKLYSTSQNARYSLAEDIDQKFCDVLEYRVYADLERGWKISYPNLEQCGLLVFEYADLDQICREPELWENSELMRKSAPEIREKLAYEFLEFLRARLALNASCLNRKEQKKLRKRSESLMWPWAIDEKEFLSYATAAWPRSGEPGRKEKDVFITPRGAFGKIINRFFPSSSSGEKKEIIDSLFYALSERGLLTKARADEKDDGYQINVDVMIWKAGKGIEGKIDPSRARLAPGKAPRPNPFFVKFYREAAKRGVMPRGLEHTAQVSAKEREEREERFRNADLPILYCSPTMELGVDISDLNVVGMRNAPPTPANYAQRGGRAGRHGQPALVIAYCARGSSHDQHFFRHPERMVAGSVTPPRLDLANEDLIRAHVNALWLAESGLDLKTSLSDLIDTADSGLEMPLFDAVRDALEDKGARDRAAVKARIMLKGMEKELKDASWYSQDWLQKTLDAIPAEFERACERWRLLYRSAKKLHKEQERIQGDGTKSKEARRAAESLIRQAMGQIDKLLNNDGGFQADFYSYRYFASEGFLPGYNFPRLPIMANVESRDGERSETIFRPRFLAISEFGPQNLVYHEGAKFMISSVNLEADETGAALTAAKLCEKCGWLERNVNSDVCPICGSRLPARLSNLFTTRTTRTTRRERISSKEEIRTQLGYKIATAYYFDDPNAVRRAVLLGKSKAPLLKLAYAQSANLWLINLGWNTKKDGAPGFLMDTASGEWLREGKKRGKNSGDLELPDPALAKTIKRMIPYVEDRKNSLLIEPTPDLKLDKSAIVSLRVALSEAIAQEYQLEANELGAAILPFSGAPRSILLYEASEGGSGVLRRLVEDPEALPRIARAALEICHFSSDGVDLGMAEKATEPCVAACYDCLMNFENQREHPWLDRRAIKDILLEIANGELSMRQQNSDAALDVLKRFCESDLERKFIDFLNEHGLKLPDEPQYSIDECRVRVDFWYAGHKTAVFVDGEFYHGYPERRALDETQEECLEDLGIEVVRFPERDNWLGIVKKHPRVFGLPKEKK